MNLGALFSKCRSNLINVFTCLYTRDDNVVKALLDGYLTDAQVIFLSKHWKLRVVNAGDLNGRVGLDHSASLNDKRNLVLAALFYFAEDGASFAELNFVAVSEQFDGRKAVYLDARLRAGDRNAVRAEHDSVTELELAALGVAGRTGADLPSLEVKHEGAGLVGPKPFRLKERAQHLAVLLTPGVNLE